MNEEMSLDVALDIIGTLRMMKINAITEEKDTNRKAVLSKELEVLTVEENVTSGLMQFEGWEQVRQSVLDKIKRLYAPILKTYYQNSLIDKKFILEPDVDFDRAITMDELLQGVKADIHEIFKNKRKQG